MGGIEQRLWRQNGWQCFTPVLQSRLERQNLAPRHLLRRLVADETDSADIPHDHAKLAQSLHIVTESHWIQKLVVGIAKPDFTVPIGVRLDVR